MNPFKKNTGAFFIRLAIFIMLVCFNANRVNAQSMGISSTAITPDASSILEMRTTSKGMLIPRMTTTQRDAIPSPATGLMIYNSTTNNFNFYNGSSWTVIFSGSSGVNSVSGTTNRISIGGTVVDPTVDISSGYVGQNSITTLGTIGTGIWNGSLISTPYGGTGTSTTFTQGSIVFAGASGVYNQNNSKIFWDNTNFRLGIGTASPNTALQVGPIGAGTENILIGGTASAGYMLNTQGAGDFGTVYSEATNTVGIGFTSSIGVPSRSVFKVNKTGAATFSTSVATDDNIILQPFTGGSNSFAGTITSADLTAARTYTLPDASGTLALTSSNINVASGTTGTDVGVTGSPVSLGGTVTLNIPIASATNTGKLSSTDWTTFNNKASTANPTFTGIAAFNSVNIGLQLIATAAGTTTLTSSSPYHTLFTGSTTQTIVLPAATTLANGQRYKISNNSTGLITVQLNGGSVYWILGASTDLDLVLTDNGTAAGAWEKDYRVGNNSSGKVATFNSTSTFSATDGVTYTFPSANGTLSTLAGTETLTNKTMNGASNTFTNINVSSLTGTLPIANGGTNSTATPTNGGISYGDGSSYKFSAAGTTGQVLKSNGAAAPTWATAETVVVLGSDVTSSSTANLITDLSGLSFSVTAGATYRFKAMIIFNSTASNAGTRFSINGPASPTLLAYTSQVPNGTNSSVITYGNAYDLPTSTSGNSAYTTSNIAIIEGIINPSADGTVIVRFAGENSSSCTAKAGSTLTWW